MNENTFFKDLAESETDDVNKRVISILESRFPGSKAIQNFTNKNDMGIDFTVVGNGSPIYIDVKVRKYKYKGDVALERWSNVESGKIGWSLDDSKLTDYILWIWPCNRWSLYNFKDIVKVFREKKDEWEQLYFSPKQTTYGDCNYRYHSQCIFVPEDVLKSDILWSNVDIMELGDIK